jgi:hypothetical protein
MELMKTNVKSKNIGQRVLVYGACIKEEYPDILNLFKETFKLSICLEDEHMDKIAWKISSIVRENNLSELSALTVDGSPHCVQLHYILDDLKRLFPGLKINHYVIENGTLYEVTPQAVRKSRHLKEIQDML